MSQLPVGNEAYLGQSVRLFINDPSGVSEARRVGALAAKQHGLNEELAGRVALVITEAANNIARHADCHDVCLSLTLAGDQLWGEIRDDGCGFINLEGAGRDGAGGPLEPSSATNGHGLENMRRRASQGGGQVHIDSAPGEGVSVKLMIPLKKQ